jgi:hypothetical protein
MSKQAAVDHRYQQLGQAKSGDAYNRDMGRAAREDASYHRSAPMSPTEAAAAAATSACIDDCVEKCCTCCGLCASDDPEESSSWCVIM